MTSDIKLPNTMLFRKSGDSTTKNIIYKEIGNHRNITRLSMLLDYTLSHKPSLPMQTHKKSSGSLNSFTPLTRNARIIKQSTTCSSTWKRKISPEVKQLYTTHQENDSSRQDRWVTSTKWNASPFTGAHSSMIASSYMKFRKNRAFQIQDILHIKSRRTNSNEFHPQSVSKTTSKCHKGYKSEFTNFRSFCLEKSPTFMRETKKEKIFSLQVPTFSENDFIPVWLSSQDMYMPTNDYATDAFMLYKIFKKDKAIRTDEDREVIFNFIKDMDCLRQYTTCNRRMFINILQQRSFKADEVLLKMGEPCDKFIIICLGSIERCCNGIKTIMYPGNVIGRKKFLANTLLKSEYVTKEPVKCMMIEEKYYFENLRIINQEIAKIRFDFLSLISIFKEWSMERLETIVVGMAEQECHQGEIIYNKGDYPKYIYVVKSGCLKLEAWCSSSVYNKYPIDTKQWEVAETKMNLLVVLKMMGPGSMFGCEELVNNIDRETRVTVMESSTLWIIDGELFKNGMHNY